MYNIDPKYWGESSWAFLHYITFAYPDNPNNTDKQSMKNLLLALEHTLPCRNCRGNFKNHLKKYPLTSQVLSNRKNLVQWLLKIHNEVNKMIGKKQISYNNLLKKYLTKNNTKSNIMNILIISIIIFLVIILYKK